METDDPTLDTSTSIEEIAVERTHDGEKNTEVKIESNGCDQPEDISGDSEGIPAVEDISSPAGGSKDSQSDYSDEAEIMQWRYRVLPLMQNILYFVTILFFLAGLVQLGYLQWSMFQGTNIDRQELPALFSEIAKGSPSDEELIAAANVEAAIIMESYIVERRYHQANTILMTMAWVRYLGFSTGMILALVGASFVLGMLREKQTNLSAENSGWQVSLSSSSPGLIMIVLGAILMFSTITYRQSFEQGDKAIYFETGKAIVIPALTPTAESRRSSFVQPTATPPTAESKRSSIVQPTATPVE